VSQQYDVCAQLIGRVAECVVPGCARSALRTAVGADLNRADLDRLQPERPALLRGGLRDMCRVRLQTVIHDDRTGP
jgi:hypothetical protein